MQWGMVLELVRSFTCHDAIVVHVLHSARHVGLAWMRCRKDSVSRVSATTKPWSCMPPLLSGVKILMEISLPDSFRVVFI